MEDIQSTSELYLRSTLLGVTVSVCLRTTTFSSSDLILSWTVQNRTSCLSGRWTKTFISKESYVGVGK